MASIKKVLNEIKRISSKIDSKNEKMMIAEVSDRLSMKFPTVWRIYENSFKKNKKGEIDMKQFKMTQEIYDSITSYREEGLTWIEIAERIGHKNFKSLNQSYRAFERERSSGVGGKTKNADKEGAVIEDKPLESEGNEICKGEKACVSPSSEKDYDIRATVSSLIDLFDFAEARLDSISIDYCSSEVWGSFFKNDENYEITVTKQAKQR